VPPVPWREAKQIRKLETYIQMSTPAFFTADLLLILKSDRACGCTWPENGRLER
jgi:hypothetical protein